MFLSSYFWYKTSYLACAVFLVKTAVFPWFLSKTHTVTNISHIACVNMNSNCVIGGPHISGLHIRTKSDQSHLWSYYPRGACCASYVCWVIFDGTAYSRDLNATVFCDGLDFNACMIPVHSSKHGHLLMCSKIWFRDSKDSSAQVRRATRHKLG